jgi:putative transcriptional regulator
VRIRAEPTSSRAYDQQVLSPDSLRGHLLVASPPLVDPNFDRTVILLLEHGEDGALGIVLNRPSDTLVADVLPEWQPLASMPAVVYVGGPVAPEAVIALARGAIDEVESAIPVLGELGTIDVGRDPGDAAPYVDALRIFVGYSGWAPGQLEAELAQDAWFVVSMQRDDVFAAAPDDLWRSVLRRQRGRIAMFAHCPADASVN